MGQKIRQPAVADMFYPAEPAALRTMVQGYLREATPPTTIPKAIIAPHAGYIYSGAVAATAYASLTPMRHSITRVILLGPSHRVHLRGMGVSSADHFATPLGLISIDRTTTDALLALPQVQVNDGAHLMEHSLEVHLPFLQLVLDKFSLVPLVVGDCTPGEVDEVLARMWGGEETLIVISSDLSHYHDYQTARRLDQHTSQSIEQLAYEKIGYDDACGRIPVNGLLHLARRLGLHAETVDLRNSGDTAGPRDRVVGYGAYLLH